MPRLVGAWEQVATNLSLASGVYTQVSASAISALITNAAEKKYSEFEIRIHVKTGVPAENDYIDVHLALSSIAPNGDFSPHWVGSVTLDNQSGSYHEDGLFIKSHDATVYLKSSAAVALSVDVYIRAKDFGAA